jgi:hypothetical protein
MVRLQLFLSSNVNHHLRGVNIGFSKIAGSLPDDPVYQSLSYGYPNYLNRCFSVHSVIHHTPHETGHLTSYSNSGFVVVNTFCRQSVVGLV